MDNKSLSHAYEIGDRVVLTTEDFGLINFRRGATIIGKYARPPFAVEYTIKLDGYAHPLGVVSEDIEPEPIEV